MVHLLEDDIQAKSMNRKLSSLRSFFKYLRKKEVITSNIVFGIVSPKVPKRLPSYISEQDISKGNAIIDMNNDLKSLRTELIINLFYETGIRREELINIVDTDINEIRQEIRVVGKGNKERIIPLSTETIAKINVYKAARLDRFGELQHGTLFVTDKGVKLYPKFVYNLVTNYLSKISTVSKNSPHVLRHSFATHLLNNGADINAIKELLGHASLSATQVYTHNSIAKLKEIYLKSHPRSEKLN